MGQRKHLAEVGTDALRQKYLEQYICSICGDKKVVPMLARDCETKHLETCES